MSIIQRDLFNGFDEWRLIVNRRVQMAAGDIKRAPARTEDIRLPSKYVQRCNDGSTPHFERTTVE